MTASLNEVAVAAGMIFSTKKFRCRIAHCIGGLPMILLNPFCRQVRRRPEPCVAQHDTTHPVRAFDVDGQADRSAPALAHGQVAVEVQMIEVIGCDTAELIARPGDELSVEEAPRRVAVKEHDDGA